jgi:acetylornithine/succinyldiaminopimelate/putrescine aminotransferase
MIGVELRKSVMPLLRALLDRGVWALPAGKSVLRLLPPLVISEEDLSRATAIIIETLRDV